jgi:hypothetical protein
MNVSAAILIGAAVIGGSVVWTSERAARDVRCAGYLSSASGGEALFRVTAIGIDSDKRARAAAERDDLDAMMAAGTAGVEKARYFVAGLQAAGCRLNRVE